DEKPLQITVAMDSPAGVFQVEAVLLKKLSTTGLKEHIDVDVMVNGERLILSEVTRLHRDPTGVDIPDPPVSRMSNKGE
ncbi:MAG: hypothetical protein ACXAEF_11545, partial [Candidatus Thorarchaeota archaeon]